MTDHRTLMTVTFAACLTLALAACGDSSSPSGDGDGDGAIDPSPATAPPKSLRPGVEDSSKVYKGTPSPAEIGFWEAVRRGDDAARSAGNLSYVWVAGGLTMSTSADVPMMIEPLSNHDGDGGNVLFFDGHVEFISAQGIQVLIGPPTLTPPAVPIEPSPTPTGKP